jgi:hypothetical protein
MNRPVPSPKAHLPRRASGVGPGTRGLRRLLFLMVFMTIAGVVEAQNIYSTSRRFVVHGLKQADAAILAGWADDMAARMENLVGMPVPALPGTALEFRSIADAGMAVGEVRRAQGYTEAGLTQKLLVNDLAAADHEDLLEGLCWLLANRYLIARQATASRRAGVAEAPDWLAIGMAQNMYAEQRERNLRLVTERWREGEAVAVGDVLTLSHLPQGRWIEKAWCGMLVAWWNTQPGARARWNDLFARLAAGSSVREAQLAEVADLPSARELNKAWDLWLGRQALSPGAETVSTSARLRDLRALMTVETEAYGVSVTSRAPATLSLGEMLEYRDAPWMVGLTGRLAYKMQWLSMGQSVDFQALVRKYVAYVNGLVGRGSNAGGLFDGTPSTRQLRRWLDEADAAFRDLETASERRRLYVDAVEQRMDRPSGSLESPEDLERRLYVDEVERRLGAPR